MTEILRLSKDLFDQVFMPLLLETAPEAEPFLAAGLVGEGSECFGYDDVLSCDHDFGPGFCVWLTKNHYERLAAPLEQIILRMPDSFAGKKTFLEKPRRGILKLEAFCQGLTGCDPVFLLENLPREESNRKWLSMSEAGLAALSNGMLFTDREGTFTKIRTVLEKGYPEDVRLYKLAQNLICAGQISQYNYPRTCERDDKPALTIMRGRLTEYYCSVACLLNHRFKPYYKWSARALKGLSILGDAMYKKLTLLYTLDDGEQTYDVMAQINSMIVAALHSEKLSENSSVFLTDHCRDILLKIKDRNLLKDPIPLL